MKRKIMIDAGEAGYWEVEDYTEYYQDILKAEGEEKAKAYFRPGVYSGEDIEEYNGTHFIYGYLESLAQSDRCPSFLYDDKISIKQIIVEEIKEKKKLVKCKDCKLFQLDFNGFNVEDIKYYCKADKHDLSKFEGIEIEVECDAFKSKYIEYPIKVSKIKHPTKKGITKSIGNKTGQLVKIRPTNEKYKNKTYLGLLLGDIDTGLFISHNPETLELNILRHYNPAIFVPELKEIIFGYESWWGVIKSEEEIKEITDDNINNVWYVQLLKGLESQKDD